MIRFKVYYNREGTEIAAFIPEEIEVSPMQAWLYGLASRPAYIVRVKQKEQAWRG